jgi:type I restriction enzyme S subunit
MHPEGTIFMTSRATIGVFAVNQLPASTNQGFIAVRPRRNADRWFLFEEMRSRVQEFLDNANGSTFLEISRGRFKELPLKVPRAEAIDELDGQLAPLHTKASRLAKESITLERLRDTLLPELLSGRMGVSEAVA